MGEKIGFNFDRYDLGKLLGATMLMFLMLVIGVGKVGEESSIVQKDYLDIQEKSLPHPSAIVLVQESSFVNLCKDKENQLFCNKVVYTGSVNEEEKYSYTEQYLDIIKFIDEQLLKGSDIKKQFKRLVLNGEKGKRRGGATWTKITMNLASLVGEGEYWGVLTHEFGHIVDLGLLQGVSKTKDKTYTEFGKEKFSIDDPSLEYYRYSRESETIRREKAQKSDFCSGYGMTNPFEDFAECYNLYLNNNLLFQKMTQESVILRKKYNFFANLFDGMVLQLGQQQYLYQGRRPWDTTVI